ncbi:MAG: MATE family efflux transporter [Clostridia bacterium]|nr:MATE family efflux transporter [Clostridia bacterium]
MANQQELARRMVNGKLSREILLFSLPLMLSNLLQVLFNMADIAVVGRFAGSLALGAVGSTATAVTLFTGVLIGVGGGINVLVARYCGAGERDKMRRTVHSSLLISVIIGIVFLVFGLFGSRPLLELLNTKDELIDGAALYMRIYFLGMPALAVYNFGSAVYGAVGDTKKPMYYLLCAGVLNVLLNLFFVIVLHMSVAGVALASIISQYLSAVLVLVSLIRKREEFGVSLRELRFYGSIGVDVIKLGIPSGMQNGIFYLANLFIQAAVNSFDTVMVAGNSAAVNSDGLVFDLMAAIYTACGSFIGQNYGAGKYERVKKSYLVSLAYSAGVGAIVGGGLVLLGPQFLSLFTDEPEVVEAGMYRLTIMGLGYWISAFMDCAIAASRGLGKSVVPTVIVLLGSCVFRIVWIETVFAHFGTVPSLYLLYIFSWTITAVMENLYFIHIYKKTVPLLK